VKKQGDDIDCAISDLKAIAARRGHKADWSKIEQDLRSYYAELSLVRFGSLAEIGALPVDVRFPSNSGHASALG
jgi:hypothetical protein